MMRSQISLEYIVLVSAILFVLVPLWSYFLSYYNSAKEEISLSYARDLVDSVRDMADFVHAQGGPAKVLLKVHVPNNVLSINLTENRVSVFLSLSSGITEIYAESRANLTGYVPTSPGDYLLSLEAMEGYVNVTPT